MHCNACLFVKLVSCQTKEDLSIDKKIETSLLGTAPHIHPKICTSLVEHKDSNSTKPLCSKISKIEARLSALKSYVSCEIFSSHSKIESISQSLQEVTQKLFQERETTTNEIFHQNKTF